MLQPLIRPPVILPDGPAQATQGVSAEIRGSAIDGLAALSSSVVNTVLSERLAELALSGQFPRMNMTSALMEAVGNLLQIQRQDGETLESYSGRILAALTDLPPQEQLKLQVRLDSLIKGLSLTLLRGLLENPQGPSATRLAFVLELQTNAGIRDMASRITSTYQETALGDEGQPSFSRSPAMQGPPQAPSTAGVPKPSALPSTTNPTGLGASTSALPTPSARSMTPPEQTAQTAPPQAVNDDQAPPSTAARGQPVVSSAFSAGPQDDSPRPSAAPASPAAMTAKVEFADQNASLADAENPPAQSKLALPAEARALASQASDDGAPRLSEGSAAQSSKPELPMSERQAAEKQMAKAEAGKADLSAEPHAAQQQAVDRSEIQAAERLLKSLGSDGLQQLPRVNGQTALLEALAQPSPLLAAADAEDEAALNAQEDATEQMAKIAREPEGSVSQLQDAQAALFVQIYAQTINPQILEDASAFTGFAQALLQQMPAALREGIVPAYVPYPAAPDGAAEGEDRVKAVEPEDEERHRKGGQNQQDRHRDGDQQNAQQPQPADEADAAASTVDVDPDTEHRAEDYYLRFADV